MLKSLVHPLATKEMALHVVQTGLRHLFGAAKGAAVSHDRFVVPVRLLVVLLRH